MTFHDIRRGRFWQNQHFIISQFHDAATQTSPGIPHMDWSVGRRKDVD